MKIRRNLSIAAFVLCSIAIGSVNTGCGRTHTFWGVESENYYGDDGYKHGKKPPKPKKEKKHKKHKKDYHHD